MARLLFGLGVAYVVFTIYAVADCAFFDRSRVRGLSRGWWIVVIMFVPIIGGVLWFIIGRGRANRVGPSRGGTMAPDDDAEFLRQLRNDAAQAERIRRLEQDLAELDADDAPRGALGPGRTSEGASAAGTAGAGSGAAASDDPFDPGDALGTERKQRPDAPDAPGEAGPTGRPNA
ncbi:PLD nuclease N-terminal domain-containing protein [Agromyces sp. Marseille-P2726]|uniref:PLD nuclease N-terminal domain-containing protein n=1 Tax=Agromyces sp. Marseille-P2726 TaxID=2709132 RepID=UPI0015704C65|nr:PLD nuclease N-terminal domain-containing protein [Agromyces sp. Marseille-P2726]